MRAPVVATAAAIVLGVQGLALAAIAGFELLELGTATALPTGLALITLTLIGAAALIAFAVGVRVGKSWARSGAVVLEVLALIVAIGALTIENPSPVGAAAVGVPALLGLVLTVASARAEGRPESTIEPSPEGENPDR